MFETLGSLTRSGGFSVEQAPDSAGETASLKKFQKIFQQSLTPKAEGTGKAQVAKNYKDELKEAARQMEIQMMTMMFKSMEKASSEEGMLGGGKSAGMSHFKDMFFIQVAEEAVNRQGLGFAENLLNAYETKHLNR